LKTGERKEKLRVTCFSKCSGKDRCYGYGYDLDVVCDVLSDAGVPCGLCQTGNRYGISQDFMRRDF
jgi:hypothetical protein